MMLLPRPHSSLPALFPGRRRPALLLAIWALAAASLSAFAAPPADAPVLQTDNDSHVTRIQTKAYQATVEGDGFLTSFAPGGQEFILAKTGLPRGAYLYQNGPVKLTEILRPSDHAVAAKGDAGSLTYEFQPRSLTITAANASSSKMLFYLAVAPNAAAMMDTTGNAFKTPVKLSDQPATTWFAGKQRLKIEGDQSHPHAFPWGDDHLQIWQVDLDANETRTITLTAGEATKEELSAVSKAVPQ